MPQHDTQRPRTAWKLGQWLGSGYRAFLRQEARFVAWLTGHGVPRTLARILPWAFRIVAVLVLLVPCVLGGPGVPGRCGVGACRP